MVDVIHVHEDFWGMRNLYPLVVRTEADEDVAAAVASSERNRDASGLGYTDAYLIKPPSKDYADFGLTLVAAEAAISPHLPRVKRFNATILSAMGSGERDALGSYEEDAWAFGSGPGCFIKLDAKGPLVGKVWFDLHTDDAAAENRLRGAIEAIDALVPSVIADYFLGFSGPVSGDGVLDRYFAELGE